MILSAADSPLQIGTLPNVQGAMLDWFQPITFTKIVKTIVNFKPVEVETEYSFRGVRQPLSPQQLQMKPESQRSWRWEQIHSDLGLILEVDERITLKGLKYRVMARLDYREYGYLEYHITQDYQ